jgi:hypothetical protein
MDRVRQTADRHTKPGGFVGLAAEVRRLRDEEKLQWTQIGHRLGLSRDRAVRLYGTGDLPPGVIWTEGLGVLGVGTMTPDMESPPVHPILDVPVRPFEVPVPKIPKSKKGKWRHAVLYGDSHFPYQDDRALGVVKSIIADVKPDILVDMGDTLDCYTISRYSKDPNRRGSLQDEIDMGRTHLHQFAQIAPDAEKYLLDSNHFARLMKVIHGMQGESRELARLRSFQETMNWPHLLGLSEIGWNWIPENMQPRSTILPKVILKHGSIVRKGSAMSARAEYERYGRNGASGHTHRLGKFYHRDLDGCHVWLETGCTCRLDPDYIPDGHPEWQQGCVIFTYSEDHSRFHAEDVFIHEGRTVWRDRDIVAA